MLVVDKGALAEAGGNARFSHTGFRSTYAGPADIQPFVLDVDRDRWAQLVLPGYSADDFRRDLDRATAGRIDASLRDRLAESAAPTLRWMVELGIPWTLNRTLADDVGEHFEPGLILAAGRGGGGRELVQAWLELAADRSIEVRFDTAVVDVRLAVAGGPHEVEVVERGLGETFRCDSLVVCSGGFQADPAMRARYLGSVYGSVPVRGSRHDTGEILELLVRAGAARDGSWDLAVVTPVDADSPAIGGGNEMNRYSYPWGITVDRQGRRFFDEGAGRSSDTYGAVGRHIVEHAGGRAWQIFDATGVRYLKSYAYRFARTFEADTIEGLAGAAGIQPAGLARTVAEFNAAIRTGVPFDPTTLDGRSTTDIEPPKSNWATAIETPPFRAYAVTGGLTFTLGGLRIDPDARVLDGEGRPLPGVFASGDAVGLFHGDYPSGTGQTRNAVFGRLAGEGAAEHALRAAGHSRDDSDRRPHAAPPVPN